MEVKYITVGLLWGGGRATLITPIWLCFVINVTDNLLTMHRVGLCCAPWTLTSSYNYLEDQFSLSVYFLL